MARSLYPSTAFSSQMSLASYLLDDILRNVLDSPATTTSGISVSQSPRKSRKFQETIKTKSSTPAARVVPVHEDGENEGDLCSVQSIIGEASTLPDEIETNYSTVESGSLKEKSLWANSSQEPCTSTSSDVLHVGDNMIKASDAESKGNNILYNIPGSCNVSETEEVCLTRNLGEKSNNFKHKNSDDENRNSQSIKRMKLAAPSPQFGACQDKNELKDDFTFQVGHDRCYSQVTDSSCNPHGPFERGCEVDGSGHEMQNDKNTDSQGPYTGRQSYSYTPEKKEFCVSDNTTVCRLSEEDVNPSVTKSGLISPEKPSYPLQSTEEDMNDDLVDICSALLQSVVDIIAQQEEKETNAGSHNDSETSSEKREPACKRLKLATDAERDIKRSNDGEVLAFIPQISLNMMNTFTPTPDVNISDMKEEERSCQLEKEQLPMKQESMQNHTEEKSEISSDRNNIDVKPDVSSVDVDIGVPARLASFTELTIQDQDHNVEDQVLFHRMAFGQHVINTPPLKAPILMSPEDVSNETEHHDKDQLLGDRILLTPNVGAMKSSAENVARDIDPPVPLPVNTSQYPAPDDFQDEMIVSGASMNGDHLSLHMVTEMSVSNTAGHKGSSDISLDIISEKTNHCKQEDTFPKNLLVPEAGTCVARQAAIVPDAEHMTTSTGTGFQERVHREVSLLTLPAQRTKMSIQMPPAQLYSGVSEATACDVQIMDTVGHQEPTRDLEVTPEVERQSCALTAVSKNKRTRDQTVPSLHAVIGDDCDVDAHLAIEESIYAEKESVKDVKQPQSSGNLSIPGVERDESTFTVPDHLATQGQPAAGVFQWTRTVLQAASSPAEVHMCDTLPWAPVPDSAASNPMTPVRALPHCPRKRRVGLSRRQCVRPLHARKLFEK